MTTTVLQLAQRRGGKRAMTAWLNGQKTTKRQLRAGAVLQWHDLMRLASLACEGEAFFVNDKDGGPSDGYLRAALQPLLGQSVTPDVEAAVRAVAQLTVMQFGNIAFDDSEPDPWP